MVRGPTLESAVLRQLKRIIFSKYNTGTSILIVQEWANPGFFFIYFRPFKHTLQFLQQINVKKCPSSIRHWDSNSRPLEHESPPITTKPGLPPKMCPFYKRYFSCSKAKHFCIHWKQSHSYFAIMLRIVCVWKNVNHTTTQSEQEQTKKQKQAQLTTCTCSLVSVKQE